MTNDFMTSPMIGPIIETFSLSVFRAIRVMPAGPAGDITYFRNLFI